MLAKTSRIVALCSAANFINAADRVIMPIAIVPMTDEFKWSLHWQGMKILNRINDVQYKVPYS